MGIASTTPLFLSMVKSMERLRPHERKRGWNVKHGGRRGSKQAYERMLWWVACMLTWKEAVLASKTVHVAMCPSQSQTQGMLVAVRSIVEACNATDTTLHFHVITTNQSVPVLRDSLSCLAMTHPVNYSTYAVDPSKWPSDLSTRVRSKLLRGYGLEDPLNYARFFMDRMLPWKEMNFETVFYIDTDCVVQTCIAPLYWKTFNGSNAVVAAAARRTKISKYAGIKLKHPKVIEWNQSHQHKINGSLVAFNAGVLLLNLKQWEEQHMLEDVLYWIAANSKGYVYEFGSNPPLILGLAGRVEYLPGAWNMDGLGHRRHMALQRIRTANVLHWTGVKKPWSRNAYPEYQKLWQRFRQVDCEKDR